MDYVKFCLTTVNKKVRSESRKLSNIDLNYIFREDEINELIPRIRSLVQKYNE